VVEALREPEPWKETSMFTEREVRSGVVPPPEIVAREVAESVHRCRRVTAKEWSPSWYEDRFGEPGLSERVCDAVEELARVEGVTSVPSVMGRLGIDPSYREEVELVLGGCV